MSLATDTLDTTEAAKFLGVSKSHLEKLRVEDPDCSPPFFRVGRSVRYSRSNLGQWIAKQMTTPQHG